MDKEAGPYENLPEGELYSKEAILVKFHKEWPLAKAILREMKQNPARMSANVHSMRGFAHAMSQLNAIVCESCGGKGHT